MLGRGIIPATRGRRGADGSSSAVADSFTGVSAPEGTDTAIGTLSPVPDSADGVTLFVNGVLEPQDVYHVELTTGVVTWLGTTAGAPLVSTDVIEIRYFSA